MPDTKKTNDLDTEFEFKPLHKEEHVEKVKKWFLKNHGDRDKIRENRNTIDFILVGETDGSRGFIGAGCHAGVKNPPVAGKVVLIGNRFRAIEHDAMEKAREYVKFLCSDENPLSRFIVNRETAIKDHGIIHSGCIPYQLSHLMNLQTRFITERMYCLNEWAKMVKNGVPPFVAMFLADTLSITTNNGVYSPSSAGHGQIFKKFSCKLFDNLVEGRWANVDWKRLYCSHREYYGSSNVGVADCDRRVYNSKTSLYPEWPGLEEAFTGKSSKSAAPTLRNPFAKASVPAYGSMSTLFTYKEFEKTFLPFITKRYKEKLNG